MKEQSQRLTTGLQPFYLWDDGRSSFLAADWKFPDMPCMKRVYKYK